MKHAPVFFRTLGRGLAVVLLAAALSTEIARGLETSGVPAVSLQELEEFRAKGAPEEAWPRLMEALGREEQRVAIRTLVTEQKPFPAARLTALLAHPKLAVRLGALDLLEDAAGETYGFDPWQEAPEAGRNAEALARWKVWAEGGSATLSSKPAALTAEAFRAMALEIMTGDRERAERAMQRLEAYGLSAIGQIEVFLQNQPELEPAPRAMLKAAEYRLAIRQVLPKNAAALARDLALGTPEAQSTALAALGEAGPGVLPVIAEALSSGDSLVRETAVDAAFKAGTTHALPVILEHLAGEKTESVLHAALRGLGQHAREPEQAQAIAAFLVHPSENVVVSALAALGATKAGDVSTALQERLADPRWRVRAAALETIGKRDLKALMSPVSERLKDDDLFVRVSAVRTLQTISEEGGATKLLLERFEQQDDLKAAILPALFVDEKPAPPQVWDALWKAPPEIILQCLDLLGGDDGIAQGVPHAARFVRHTNRDVAASALRLLASQGKQTGLLLEALRSPDDLRRDAVLDALRLRPGFLAASGSQTLSAPAGPRNSLLDRLYSLFESGAKPAAENGAETAQPGGEAAPHEMRAALEDFLRKGSPQQRLKAAVVLLGQSHEEAARFLLASIETSSSLDRRAMASALAVLPEWPRGPVQDLATRLLQDPADDVREVVVEIWLDNKKPERFAGLLTELARRGSPLRATDLYGYEADSLAQNPQLQKPLLEWGRAVLEDSAALESTRVLAIVLLGRSGQARAAQVERFLDSDRPWLRRAAYRALGASVLPGRIEALLRDEAAPVRAVLPFLASPHNQGWLHWFSDAESARDYEDFGGRASSRPTFGAWAGKGSGTSGSAEATPELLAALEKLTRDPADSLRFEAQFALLRLGKPVDPTALASLISAPAEDTSPRARLGDFLEQHYRRLGRGYSILVPLATGVGADKMKILLSHFGAEKPQVFTSFASLAQLAAPNAAGADLAVSAPTANSSATPAAAFQVIFFYKPGCRDCDRVRDMLARHAKDLRQMTIRERDINATESAVLNEALSARFQLRDTLRQVTPAVFTQAGALVKDDLTFPRLGDLLRSAATVPPDPGWAEVRTGEVTAAQETITQRYQALSF
ncbi:MAG TPA: HEAT repeat domain-containing protein, partial [Chthoniobacteraceae bacterium]